MDAEITTEELKSLLDDDVDVRIVDIRSERQFERGHIPGSECVPFPRLPTEVSAFDGADHVVTVCPHGKSSVQAARLIQSYEGLADDARVESLAGGLGEWEYDLDTGSDNGDSSEGPESPF